MFKSFKKVFSNLLIYVIIYVRGDYNGFFRNNQDCWNSN